MKYNLIGNNNYQSDNLLEEILTNRGITDIDSFLNISENVIPNPLIFTNMDKAVDLILTHMENNSTIGILIDSDCDGITSASIMYNTIRFYSNDIEIKYFNHSKKTHGIQKEMIKSKCFKDIDLLIIPDAGSLDHKEHNQVKKQGVKDILVIDHHPCKELSPYAITVNNQYDKKYTNLSGAGMAYLVCKALDMACWEDNADNYLDLVAIGLIADDMITSDPLVQYFINKGLSNIQSPIIQAFIDKQEYYLKGILNPIGVSYNIAPMINSVFRIGTIEEKNIMFEAFANIDTERKFPYTATRGAKKGITVDESLYEHCARMCESINGKRKRLSDKMVIPLEEQIKETDKVICVQVEEASLGMSGLLANALQYKYGKPTIVWGTTNSKTKDTVIGSGSLRASTGDFKSRLQKTGLFEFVEGHQDAAGLQIKQEYLVSNETLREFKQKLNEHFKDDVFEKIYTVDFDLPKDSLDFYFIKELYELKDYYSKSIFEPLIHISNLKVSVDDILLMGAKQNTIKISSTDFDFIKFKSDIDEWQKLVQNSEREKDKMVTINLIGKASINEYQGKVTPQIIVEAWERIDS